MYKQQTYNFRTALIDQGILEIKDYSKIKENISFEETVESLAVYFQSQEQEFQDIAKRIYLKFLQSSKVVQGKKLLQLQNILDKYKQFKLFKKFMIWKNKIELRKQQQELERLKQYVRRLVEENKNIQTGVLPKQIVIKQNETIQNQISYQNDNKAFQHNLKFPSHTYNLERTEEIAKNLLFHNVQSPISMNSSIHQVKSRSQTCSPRNTSSTFVSKQETPKSQTPRNKQIHERLYQESFDKRQIQEQKALQKDFKELQSCTFRPDLRLTDKRTSRILQQKSFNRNNSSYEQTSSVYERLNQTYKRFKSQLLEFEKDSYELKDCTFHPDILQTNTQRREYETFQKLHSDYERQQHLLRTKKVQQNNLEIQDCTFQPSTLSTQGKAYQNLQARSTSTISQKVYDRLYSQFQTYQNNKIKKVQQIEEEFQKDYTFIPQVIGDQVRSAKQTPSILSPSNQTSKETFERLYRYKDQHQRYLNNLKDVIQKEEQEKINQSIPHYAQKKKQNYNRSKSAGTFNRRYHNKKKQDTQFQAQQELQKERGIIFTPQINKSSQNMLKSQSNKNIKSEEQSQSELITKQRQFSNKKQFEELNKAQNQVDNKNNYENVLQNQQQTIQKEKNQKNANEKTLLEFQQWKMKQDQVLKEYNDAKDERLIPKMIQTQSPKQQKQVTQTYQLKQNQRDQQSTETKTEAFQKQQLIQSKQNKSQNIYQKDISKETQSKIIVQKQFVQNKSYQRTVYKETTKNSQNQQQKPKQIEQHIKHSEERQTALREKKGNGSLDFSFEINEEKAEMKQEKHGTNTKYDEFLSQYF